MTGRSAARREEQLKRIVTSFGEDVLSLYDGTAPHWQRLVSDAMSKAGALFAGAAGAEELAKAASDAEGWTWQVVPASKGRHFDYVEARKNTAGDAWVTAFARVIDYPTSGPVVEHLRALNGNQALAALHGLSFFALPRPDAERGGTGE